MTALVLVGLIIACFCFGLSAGFIILSIVMFMIGKRLDEIVIQTKTQNINKKETKGDKQI
jgi:hypothetical protein